MENSTCSCPLKRPGNHRPPIPRWRLHLPDRVDHVYTAYIGIQQHSTDPVPTQSAGQAITLIEAWITKETNSSSLTSESFTALDGSIRGSSIWVCYWTREEDYERSIKPLSFPALYSALVPQGRESIGLWCERFSTTSSRFSTNYTGLDYLPGLGRLPGTTTSEHDLTAYWGAARDRIPDSAHDLFECEDPPVTAVPEIVPKGIGQHLIGHNYNNVVYIRSGQFWESCSAVESQAYEVKLEPALQTGLQYLWQNPVDSGAIGVRYLRNTECNGNVSGRVRKDTCAAGFLRSLGDLEQWAKKHPSHLKIYHGALQHAREFGGERKLRTWHEISVLKSGEARFEYVNCRPETGVIRFVALEGIGLEGQV
ncbi:putative phenylacetaldoxime dehydratase family protein [Zopfia rhizophila CBS 207.26]|uniref:Putative phenylacetaldoxime dehydratase family protein n=1 Tax=Zopfia rhizophila CBS 207.26 TaxID=1314779 RepID=A0A6A6E3U4_9PEZI|nr:putative phenylacetaldoxime dehydratase family protein [Zopfia rhizophila CBS 207.26]